MQLSSKGQVVCAQEQQPWRALPELSIAKAARAQQHLSLSPLAG